MSFCIFLNYGFGLGLFLVKTLDFTQIHTSQAPSAPTHSWVSYPFPYHSSNSRVFLRTWQNFDVTSIIIRLCHPIELAFRAWCKDLKAFPIITMHHGAWIPFSLFLRASLVRWDQPGLWFHPFGWVDQTSRTVLIEKIFHIWRRSGWGSFRPNYSRSMQLQHMEWFLLMRFIPVESTLLRQFSD